MPHCGANHPHREFGVKASSKTIQKVFRQEGLNRSCKSKRSKQRDLRAWKEANLEPLRYFQVDTKDCQDVPYYVECTWKAHFPRYLYQAKDVRTGVLYSAFAYERTAHNGTDFVCNSPDLTRRSAFEVAAESAQARLKRIPPRACTW